MPVTTSEVLSEYTINAIIARIVRRESNARQNSPAQTIALVVQISKAGRRRREPWRESSPTRQTPLYYDTREEFLQQHMRSDFMRDCLWRGLGRNGGE